MSKPVIWAVSILSKQLLYKRSFIAVLHWHPDTLIIYRNENKKKAWKEWIWWRLCTMLNTYNIFLLIHFIIKSFNVLHNFCLKKFSVLFQLIFRLTSDDMSWKLRFVFTGQCNKFVWYQFWSIASEVYVYLDFGALWIGLGRITDRNVINSVCIVK